MVVWQDALTGLREMGLNDAATILEESSKLIGGNPSSDRKQLLKQLDTVIQALAELDHRFYALIDLDSGMMNYIRSHRSAFYFDGVIKKLK
jgi:ATP phosphoribosyltransferase